MKKTTFNISFDEDKASALVLYLSQKGTSVETELEKALDTLYSALCQNRACRCAGIYRAALRQHTGSDCTETEKAEAAQNGVYRDQRGERR